MVINMNEFLYFSGLLFWAMVAIFIFSRVFYPLAASISIGACTMIALYRNKAIKSGRHLNVWGHVTINIFRQWWEFFIDCVPTRVSCDGFEWNGIFKFHTYEYLK